MRKVQTIKTISVYDKPMCCSTGVCGPDVDPVLPQFAADLEWLKSRGHEVRRYNLAQEPAPFLENPSVKQVIDRTGGEGLPVILVNDQVVSEGTYPAREQLARWVEVEEPVTLHEEVPVAGTKLSPIFDERIAELVALGASVAANCEPCLKYHHRKAVELGIHPDDMIQAVNVSFQVKERPAQMMLQLAQRLLANQTSDAASGCCGGARDECR